MEKIRIGNDIGIRWEIYVRDGEDVAPYDLTGRTLKLYLSNMYQRLEHSEFSTDGNAVVFTFRGRDQRSLGRYRLTLVENDGAEGMHTVDECDAFELVRFSCFEGGNAESHVEIKRLTLASVMTMSGGGGGGGASNPDGEDLTTNKEGKLQFKDRDNTDGMGYVILRKNKTFAEQVIATNTIYEIRYNFEVGSAAITIPQGCSLRFNGGMLKNGTLNGNFTDIIASNTAHIFDGVTLGGTFNAVEVYPEWFGAKTLVQRTTDNTTPNDAIASTVIYPPAGVDSLADSSDAIMAAMNLSVISGGHAKLNGYIYRIDKTVKFPEKCTLDSEPETVVFAYMSGTGLKVTTQHEELSTQNNASAFTDEELSEPVRQILKNQYIHSDAMAKAFHLNSIYCSFIGGGTISLVKSKYTIGLYVEGTGFRQMDMTYLSPNIDVVVVGGQPDRTFPDSDSLIGDGAPAADLAGEYKDTYWDKTNEFIYVYNNGWVKGASTECAYNTSLRVEIYWGWNSGRIINPQICLRDSYGFRGIEIMTRSGGWFNVGKWTGSVSYKSGHYLSIYTNYDVNFHDMETMQMQYVSNVVTHDTRMVYAIRCGYNKFPFPWDVSWTGGLRLVKMWELGEHTNYNEMKIDGAEYAEDRGTGNVLDMQQKLRELAAIPPIGLTHENILKYRTPRNFASGGEETSSSLYLYAEDHAFADNPATTSASQSVKCPKSFFDEKWSSYYDVLQPTMPFARFPLISIYPTGTPAYLVMDYALYDTSANDYANINNICEVSYRGKVFRLKNKNTSTQNGARYRPNTLVIPVEYAWVQALLIELMFRYSNKESESVNLRVYNIKLFVLAAGYSPSLKELNSGKTADRPNAAPTGFIYYDTTESKMYYNGGTSENAVWVEFGSGAGGGTGGDTGGGDIGGGDAGGGDTGGGTTGHIEFADAAVESVLIAKGVGTEGVGITEEEAAAVTDISSWFNKNTEITSFDEFSLFTGVTSLAGSDNATNAASSGAFYGCTGLKTISFPASLETINGGAFAGTTALGIDVAIPSLKSIRNNAFKNSGIKRILDLGNVTELGTYGTLQWGGEGVFYGCASLEVAIIPSSVTSIPAATFYGCSALQAVICMATTPPTLAGANAFSSTNDCPIYVPDDAVASYQGADAWSTHSARIKGISNFATDNPTLYKEIEGYLK